jgi:hypothetical protein
MRCNPRYHVADLVDPWPEQLRAWRDARSRKAEPGSTLRPRALAVTAAPAQREEARR